MSQPTDSELVISTRSGDLDAYRELVRRYHRQLYSGAYRITLHGADAGEATQAAFVKGFVHLDRFDAERPFFSWIYRILVRESLDLCAYRRRLLQYDSTSDPRRELRDPERDLQAAETSDLVRRALGGLSPEHRTVIALRHYDGLPYREIADMLELDEKTVKSRLHEARRKLRDALATSGLLDTAQLSTLGHRAPG